MSETIVISERFCGPPTSANGGYTCGKLAEVLDGPVEITLMAPPPLDQAMRRDKQADGTVILSFEGKPLAKAHASELDIDPPSPPSFEEATEAAKSYVGFEHHTFPHCFVCGPERGADGLRIFAGPVKDRTDLVAAPWIPGEALAGESGFVDPVYLWSALDCPSAFVFDYKQFTAENSGIVLGRLNGNVESQVSPHERCVVIGWKIGIEGRKYFSGSAIYGQEGNLVAAAKTTWIKIKS